ncbi:hypothetical protein PG984_007207 [Apiospora sp. TS-2023a]
MHPGLHTTVFLLPGISFLVATPNPNMRETSETDWSVVTHRQFNGDFEANFGKTSIHLLKIGYTSEVRGMADKGYFIDKEATLREMAMQVFDAEEWMGDVNILTILKRQKFTKIDCKHSKDPTGGASRDAVPFGHVFGEDEVVQADCWDEMFSEALDSDYVVARVSGKKAAGEESDLWLGRLATTCISVQLGSETNLLPKNACWYCVKAELDKLSGKKCVIIG